MSFEILNPAGLPEPRGYSHGLLAAPGGRLLFVAGQAGWDERSEGAPPGFVEQFGLALDKVLAVVRAGGGGPASLARLTIYVTDLAAYRRARKDLGRIWRARLGAHDPAVALVEVKGLVDRGALVEIEATAVVAEGT